VFAPIIKLSFFNIKLLSKITVITVNGNIEDVIFWQRIWISGSLPHLFSLQRMAIMHSPVLDHPLI
jgi:hypothetical protein